MEYICHHSLQGRVICGPVSIRRGTLMPEEGGLISLPSGEPICLAGSENGHMYFARNDDGKGMERGSITYAVAYEKRERLGAGGRRQRFTDAEIKTLCARWGRYLRPDADTILFNDDFFSADVETLREIAASVNVKTREGE